MKRILKWTVPVDDRPHLIGGGPVTHVQAHPNSIDQVDIWTIEDAQHLTEPGGQPCLCDGRHVQIVGTGHHFPDDWTPLGTAVTLTLVSATVATPAFVWHVLEVRD